MTAQTRSAGAKLPVGRVNAIGLSLATRRVIGHEAAEHVDESTTRLSELIGADVFAEASAPGRHNRAGPKMPAVSYSRSDFGVGTRRLRTTVEERPPSKGILR
jgi:hypothetical protein